MQLLNILFGAQTRVMLKLKAPVSGMTLTLLPALYTSWVIGHP